MKIGMNMFFTKNISTLFLNAIGDAIFDLIPTKKGTTASVGPARCASPEEIFVFKSKLVRAVIVKQSKVARTVLLLYKAVHIMYAL